MKSRIIIALLVSLFATSAHSYAGFATKRTARTAEVQGNAPSATDRHMLAADKFISMLHLPAMPGGADHGRPRDTSGWEGIVALVCGILGVFSFWPAFPAIVFGALGLGRGKKHHGLAMAGLILGVVAILLWIMIFVLAFSLMV